jgi:hypothetical protein
MEMQLFVHKDPYRAINSDRYLATLFCVQDCFQLSASVRLGTLLYILGRGD